MGSIKRNGLAAVVSVVALVLAVGVDPAAGATPWWHVNTVSAPAGKTGEESQVLYEVSNLGDAVVRAFQDPVTIAAKLPAGVTPKEVYAEDGAETFWSPVGGFNTQATSCSVSGQDVNCTFSGALLEYEHLMIVVYVNVAPGAGTGQSEMTVTGGGAPALVARHKLELESVEGVENYELTPEEEGGAPDMQAGSHPFQLTTTLTVGTDAETVLKPFLGEGEQLESEVRPVGLIKDLRFQLPPGLVGNPTPLPACNMHVFLQMAQKAAGAECPANTIVGVSTPIITSIARGARAPWAITESLYNLEPAIGEPARFGFTIPLGGVVILDTAVRSGGDYGVTVTVPDIPETVEFIGSQVTFWGTPADPRHDTARAHCLLGFGTIFGESCPAKEKGQPFLIMPTSCAGPLHTSVEADTWDEIGRFASLGYTFEGLSGETYSLDGCNRLSFQPSIKVAPDGQEAATPTGLSVNVHVPQEASLNPTGLTESAVKDTTVTLPAGVGLNPAGADGLQSCSLAQVGLESPEEQSCPEAAKVGTVEIHTPLLPHPLVGAAYLAQQNANPFGSLVALYIVVKDPYSGVIVKLAGQVTPDPVTGQLVSTFDKTPQLPFEDLVLHFFGGSRAPLGTPALCGSYTTTASIAPWSGDAPVDSSSRFLLTSGPNHTACPNPPGDMSASALPFAPELTTGSLNIQAGAFTPFTMTMSRQDGNQNLDAIQLKMPSGLLGTLSGVKLCPEPQANQGTCGPESLIGHTIVSVGLGGNPYTVTGGEVFITGPYKGAPYGLSIVNPAKAGPFDLGKVIVRAKIEVDPTTAALTITSDSTGPYRIPQILDGIPLQIKHVNVTIDRPSFTFNPTNCEPQQIGGSLTSSEGAVSALHVPFQVTNCAILKFKPVFKAATSGKVSRTDGASLSVKLTYPKTPFGQGANIRYVKVELPKQLPSRLETLKKACLDTVFDQNPAACPTASRVGTATATTPVIPVPLSGPAYFVSHGGARFPELIVVLSGYGTTVYLHGETFIDNKTGITSSTFKSIPDVPVGTFQLTLPQGPYSALAAPGGKLCTSTLRMPTTFIAQNGMRLQQSTPITATGCARHKPKHHNKHKKHKRKHSKKK